MPLDLYRRTLYALALLAASAFAASEQPNWCPNPRLQRGTDGKPEGWALSVRDSGSGARSQRGRNRRGCLELKLTRGGRAEWVSEPVPWRHSAADVSAWIRPQGIVDGSPRTGAVLVLRGYGAARHLLSTIEVGVAVGTKTWQYVHRLVSVPKGTREVRLAFVLRRLHHGEACLCDVVLRSTEVEQTRVVHRVASGAAVSTDRPGNVFAPGEPLYFRVAGNAESLPYRLVDDRGGLLARGRTDGNELSIEGREEWTGRYLRLMVGEGETAAMAPAAILPNRSSAEGGDRRFGCWVLAKPIELLKLALRIGVSTAYPNWNLDAASVEAYRQHCLNLTTNGIGARGLFQIWPYQELYAKGFRQDARLQQWRTSLGEYLKARRGVISDFSSLGGEHAVRNEQIARGLRDVHSAFYTVAKQADPNCRVFLGMLFARPPDLQRILSTAEPATFQYDGVSYDWGRVAEWQAEATLECHAQDMRRFNGVKPQWICETRAGAGDEWAAASHLARIYVVGLGLGCKEIDWHSFWYALPQALWHGNDFREDALFRGQNFAIAPAAIAYHHCFRHLGHARPTGQLTSDTNVVGFGFQRGDEHVAALWTRNRPATVSVRTSSETVEVHDYLGGSCRLYPLDGRIWLGVGDRLLYVEARAPMRFERIGRPLVVAQAEQRLHLKPSVPARDDDEWSLMLPSGWTAAKVRAAAFSVTAPPDTPTGSYPATALLARRGRVFAAQPIEIKTVTRFVWGKRGIRRRAPIEVETVEMRGREAVATVRNWASDELAAEVSVTSSLTDAMRPEVVPLGQVSLRAGEQRELAWPVAHQPEDIPYPLTFRFSPANGKPWDSHTYVSGLPPVTVTVPNPSMEEPGGFSVSRGPWEYRRNRDDAHSGRAYLRVLPCEKREGFTRMETGLRVNPSRRCYGRIWLRVSPESGRPVNVGYSLAVCLYSGLGRKQGPTTTIKLPALREANAWTPLDFTFVPKPAECHAWVYLDVRHAGPAVDVDDLVISERRLASVWTDKDAFLARPSAAAR